MSITSDGSQRFGIQSSPVTIGAATYVAEGMNWNFTATRQDLNDSNGEPAGSTIVPGRLEVSGTLQLAASSTLTNIRGQEMTIAVDDDSVDGTYLIVDSSVAETQGDYTKLSFNGYRKIN
tara:strand:- start:870 stop:1229 length:360 start_codon:yes stop_codon:yes gene_type:complete